MTESLIIAIVLWAASIIAAAVLGKIRYKSRRLLRPTYMLVFGTFVAAAIMFFPIYFDSFSADALPVGIGKSIVISLHHAIRLFVVDSDFEIISDAILGLSPAISMTFSSFAAILFITAPILTCNFVLSFFKNLSSYEKYIFGFFSDGYIFSELNDKSLSLAESIAADNPGALIVFNDVFEKNEEQNFEIVERAKELGAILFKKDITSVNYKLHSKRRTLSFFAIGEDESENIKQSLAILNAYHEREKTKLYVFSTSVEGELIFSGKHGKNNDDRKSSDKVCDSLGHGKVKVHRINDVRSLVYRTLYELECDRIAWDSREHTPEEEEKPVRDLFSSAMETPDGICQIGAVIIGCGLHGTEMMKTLSWFCQMDGYRVSINAFDKNKRARERFEAEFPELMAEEYNGKFIPGEAQYKIDIHPDTDVETSTFARKIKELRDTTYVFVALGTDEANIKTAVNIRMFFEQVGIHPIIQAVVYNSDKKRALDDVRNFKNEKYDIEFIGDLKTLYSESVIIDSELEQDGLRRHLAYVGASIENDEREVRERLLAAGSTMTAEELAAAARIPDCERARRYAAGEEEFYAFEYNYRSSVASALHERARIACGMPGAGKPDDSLTPEEAKMRGSLEHRRWNAYMRSEGYIFGEKRNDIGKVHPLLVNYKKLSDSNILLDIMIGNK